ncbi:MAG TPA: class I SAM-dependent methyltransferase [Gemmatimonadaceae bacterium]|jgi:SAM-dependent methyltransferase|nr:class I SAM-dependent methyltransferase [Gemmatimonadaceae bacterium]
MTTLDHRATGRQRAGSEEADWFEEWFGEDYLRIYQHRDELEAEHAIELIAANLPGRQIDAVLDLGCGAGRHTRVLFERWWTVGLDLSLALLRVARRESPDAPYVRADMRELPFADRSFDLVVNLFTSFGYFDDDVEHARVLSCVGHAMRPGATFVIDFLNASQVRRELVPYDERVENGITIEQRREITSDNRFVQKTITLRDKGKEYIERVRLLSAADLERMLADAGFTIDRLFGDYGGAEWSESSPRTILFASRQ